MAPGESPPEQCPFALTNASVVAGDLAGTMLLEATVLVARTGTIEKAGPSGQVPVPAGYRHRPDRAMRPAGLINAHAHVFEGGRLTGSQLRPDDRISQPGQISITPCAENVRIFR